MAHVQNTRNSTPVATAAGYLFTLVCLQVLFSVFYRTTHLATHAAGKSWAVGLLGLLACGVAYRARHVLGDGLIVVINALPSFVSAPFTSLVVGLLLRVLWIARVHSPFTSDGAGYFNAAVGLMHGQVSEPYWPPGFSLFLVPFFATLGAAQWVAWLCSLLLYMATWALVTRLAIRLSGFVNGGTTAGWLLALWPGYIAVSSINSKEILLACILSAIMFLCYLQGSAAGLRLWLCVLGVGVLTGCAALTQPGFTLFPAVLLLSDWLRTRQLPAALVRTAALTVAMFAVILPWTLHNYHTQHRYILISTNGGSVFYTANNAHANASYSEEAQQALPKDTVEADRIGYQLGKQWIREHPLDFAVLAVRKQVVFLGDDGIGVYESFKRGKPVSSALYAGLKGICSLFWLLLWLGLFLNRRSLLRAGQWQPWYGLAFLPFVYQLAIDSVFESGSRHHMAYVGALALIAAVAWTRVAGVHLSRQRAYALPTVM